MAHTAWRTRILGVRGIARLDFWFALSVSVVLGSVSSIGSANLYAGQFLAIAHQPRRYRRGLKFDFNHHRRGFGLLRHPRARQGF